ncbi:MAG TPA: CBS domain-containing protein [Solirubrobacteraceae bacterium]|jgi:CBS domain-containing protein
MTNTADKLLVSDVMTNEVITCPGSATLGSVATTLVRRNVHAVFVLDDAGQPSGVVTDFDLLAGEWMGTDTESLQSMQNMTARELATSPVETINADAPAVEAAARLRELHLGRLLVTDERGSPLGVISVSDLVDPLGGPTGDRRSVQDVMSYAIVTCLPDTPLEAAARAMTERRSRSIIVIDDDGRAAGVVTGNDLLSLYEPGEHAGTVADLMSAPSITAKPDLALAVAAELMIEHEVHRLVVIDPARNDEAPIGTVSTSDILAEMADERSVWQRASV